MNKKIFDKVADRETAIKNLGGNVAMYEKYLEKFRTKYVNADEEIKNFIAEDNAEEARRATHSVKGLSATLGLMALSNASFELEMLLKKAIEAGLSEEPLRSEIFAALDKFKAELTSACE